MYYDHLSTPLGSLLVVANQQGLCHIKFSSPSRALAAGWQRRPTLLHGAKEQLAAYFAGELLHFDLPLCPLGTDFQQRVWAGLQRIPYGTTLSYKMLAQQIGKPQAQRAVGAANGRNPLSIVVPCHRVINSDGGLGGYAGGLAVKQWLLQHERTYGLNTDINQHALDFAQ